MFVVAIVVVVVTVAVHIPSKVTSIMIGITSMLVLLIANTVGPVPVDGMCMSCYGYCARCDTIHTLPTTAGTKKVAALLRRKILPSLTQYLNHPPTNHTDRNHNHNNKYDISLPDRWWLEQENQIKIDTGEKNATNPNEGFALEFESQFKTELLLDGSASLSSISVPSYTSPIASSLNTSSQPIIRQLRRPPIRRGKMLGVVEVYVR